MSPKPPKPPKPVLKLFLVSRELFEDKASGDFIVVLPKGGQFTHREFPCTVPMSFLVQITSMRGAYLPLLQLRDLEDRAHWTNPHPMPIDAPDPLALWTQTCRRSVFVPWAGKYDVVLLVNDEELARYPVVVAPPKPPG